MTLDGDIAGCIPVTMPSEKELDKPEVKDYVANYLKAAAPADQRMRITRFLHNWVAGLHGVVTSEPIRGPVRARVSMCLFTVSRIWNRKRRWPWIWQALSVRGVFCLERVSIGAFFTKGFVGCLVAGSHEKRTCFEPFLLFVGD